MDPAKATAPPVQREGRLKIRPLGEVILTKVAPRGEPDDHDVTGYALRDWGRTARYCAIRLTEALAGVAPIVAWVIIRR
jgi:hypothetical protein